eukprot:Plantae.Rhodophyta-Palmaria_palmata.ctg8474.p1 GENE.Plantae.Rhodophyta-Palmaria_palmata.ctg8474~~Plantae.Rhodophyta-Palmaria_palmata.ctg8474.p1  ORF type:complete len:212 (+),score=26.73 Plantae.Rhodophyta-Palmaria_palmata.ctg8474:59-694(+)
MCDAVISPPGMNSGGLEVVLGSASKWRRQLFASRLPDLQFSTAAADIDEKAVTAGYADRGRADPERLTLALAHAKADAILPTIPKGKLLITSDQVLAFNGSIREKPEDASACRDYLRSYAEEPVVTVTALVVTNSSASGKRSRVEVVDIAKQFSHAIPENIIDALIAKGDVLYSAGGITVEDPLLAPYIRERVGTEDSSELCRDLYRPFGA